MKFGMVHLQNFIKKMLNEWMSNWYGESWWTFNNIPPSLNQGMNEVIVNSNNHNLLTIVQQQGFELVETALEFETTILNINHKLCKNIRQATIKDLPKITQITDTCFSSNKDFFNRFKNPSYFTIEQSKDYYLQSVTNYFPHSITSVVEEDNKVVGYYMIKKQEDNKYKGIMTGVLPSYRGKKYHAKMQDFVFKKEGLPFTTLNATQINNLGTLNSHIKQGRKLIKTKYIFYKKL